MNFLSGKKTYILGAAGLITVGAYLLGLLNLETANVLLGLFGFGSVISLRAAL